MARRDREETVRFPVLTRGHRGAVDACKGNGWEEVPGLPPVGDRRPSRGIRDAEASAGDRVGDGKGRVAIDPQSTKSRHVA
jgi:hypothetical protein